MISTKDIVKAVNTKLKKDFTELKVKSTDNRKNVEPGSFYVEYPRPTFDGSDSFKHEAGTIHICYFPKDEHNYRMEFADMQIKLCDAFSGALEVTKDFVIGIDELTFDESDDVLLASFDYETWQLMKETGDDMEHIEVSSDMENIR